MLKNKSTDQFKRKRLTVKYPTEFALCYTTVANLNGVHIVISASSLSALKIAWDRLGMKNEFNPNMVQETATMKVPTTPTS